MRFLRRTGMMLLAGSLAFGQMARADDAEDLTSAVEEYNAAHYVDSAAQFFEIAENSGEPELQYRAEYYLALSLSKLELYNSAIYYDSVILQQGEQHPYYLKAVENMMDAMTALGDKFIIPNALDKNYNDTFAKLPKSALDRVNYLIGLRSFKQKKFKDAEDFLGGVPEGSAVYAKAIYLKGLQTYNRAMAERDDGRKKTGLANAATAYEKLLKLESSEKVKYDDLADLKQLSTIALARVRYAEGKFNDAYKLQSNIPLFSRHWRDALFEGAYAAFMNEDYGRALGMLHTLHAPMAKDQLVPESWLLKSYVYFYSCMYDETKATVEYFKKTYAPLIPQVDDLIKANQQPEIYYLLVLKGEHAKLKMPTSVRNELLKDEEIRTRRANVYALEQEIKKLKSVDVWQKSLLGKTLIEFSQQTRNEMIQVIGKNIVKGLKEVKYLLEDMDGAADIVILETAKIEKDLFESGFEQEKVLSEQKLYRPGMSSKGTEYWDFEGEFWPDEMGFYRYTLKNACVTPDKSK